MTNKRGRCDGCKFSEFANSDEQIDVNTREPLGRCHYEAPAAVVLRVPMLAGPQELNRIARRAGNEPAVQFQEVVTGAFPVVRASQWCRHFEPAA